MLIHSSSRCRVFLRSLSSFSSCPSRFSFWSSQNPANQEISLGLSCPSSAVPVLPAIACRVPEQDLDGSQKQAYSSSHPMT